MVKCFNKYILFINTLLLPKAFFGSFFFSQHHHHYHSITSTTQHHAITESHHLFEHWPSALALLASAASSIWLFPSRSTLGHDSGFDLSCAWRCTQFEEWGVRTRSALADANGNAEIRVSPCIAWERTVQRSYNNENWSPRANFNRIFMKTIFENQIQLMFSSILHQPFSLSVHSLLLHLDVLAFVFVASSPWVLEWEGDARIPRHNVSPLGCYHISLKLQL